MARDPQRKLVVPTLLAVCAIAAAPSCKDESSDDTSASASAEGDTGADTTISGENECFDILELSACENEAAFECRWDADNMGCLPNCPAYTEQAACDGDYFCVWLGDACADGAI